MFRYYELLSDLGGEQIALLKKEMEAGVLHPKEIKKRLARELTARFHSDEAARLAEQNFEKVFQKGGVPDDIQVVQVTASEDIWIPQLLVDMELVKSTSDGRRMIKQNAVSLDGEKVTDVNAVVRPQGEVLVKVGKLRYCKVCFRLKMTVRSQT